MNLKFPIRLSADEHRMDGGINGNQDDFFLTTGPRYGQYRKDHPEGTWVHLGDTFDTLRAEPKDIANYWHWLEKWEDEDIFILGNHEITLERLQSIAPGLCLESLDLPGGWHCEHGHRLFKVSTYESMLAGVLLFVHRRVDRNWAWVESRLEAIYSSHRTNEPAYKAFLSEEPPILQAFFGHTHKLQQEQGWWNPGALWREHTIIVLDGPDAAPRFEVI